jgi:6-phosphogluconolactonase
MHEPTDSKSNAVSRRTVLTATAATAAAAVVPALFGASRAEAAALPAARPARHVARDRGDLLFVGTWQGTEIYGARFDPATGALTALGPVGAAVANWATMHPRLPILYVGSGLTGGYVYSFAIDRATGALTQTGAVATDSVSTANGGGLAYIAVDEPSSTLLVADFEAGTTTTLPLGRDGALGDPVSSVADTGSGPNARQAGPHPHQAVVDPSGRYVLVPDFGADHVFIYPFDRATRVLKPGPGGPAAFPVTPGSGPRRIWFHPGTGTAYLLSELTAGLQVLSWDPRKAALSQVQALFTNSAGFTGTSSAAELALSRDGRFAYASNRGENTLVVYAIDQRTGLLGLIQRLPCGGTTPWSFTLHPSGRWLLVANEVSNTVDVFGVAPRTGLLTATGTSLPVPNPDGITFAV